jgi:MoxR-like ATPase
VPLVRLSASAEAITGMGTWNPSAPHPQSHWRTSRPVAPNIEFENESPMDAASLVKGWLHGRASVDGDGRLQFDQAQQLGLAAKFRRAYRWIAEQSLLPGTLDLKWEVRQRLSHQGHTVELPKQESLSSFILLPLLTLMTSRRMVFVGAPGHGKTSMATLMGLLAGHSLQQIRRAVQHGHPQLTVSDLLGSPLPSDLVRAASMGEIRVAWREWIRMRVKIIDEYNRIPTKTQSALLSLMAEGYAEMFEQTIESGRSAWFLTANDDMGGGTFPVIEALRDRIDVVVRCAPFHTRHLNVLAQRIESDQSPEQFVPSDIVLTADELDAADREIRAIRFPDGVLDVLGYFLGQLDFCRRASGDVDAMNKDTLHLSGRRVAHVCTEDCPLDKQLNLCSQTEGGGSPRTYQSIVHYAKALAYFRGHDEVAIEDLRQLVPWLLFDKIRVNPQSQFFQKTENKVYLTDRAAWLRQMFDRALQQHASYLPVRTPFLQLEQELAQAETLGSVELQRKQSEITKHLQHLLEKHELNAPVHEDILRLKMLHARCQQVLEER